MTRNVSVAGRNYITMEDLGEGGFCTVSLAFDSETGQQVALRELIDISDPEGIFMFQNGTKVHKILNGNKGFPKFYGSTGTRSVMEYVRGKTLYELGKTSEDVALAIAYQLAQNLENLHRAGEWSNDVEIGPIHRDIHPSNIFSTPEGKIILTDFDSALVDDVGLQYKTRTNGYMSPEQANDETESPLSDIYSAGCVLFYSMTGRSPDRDLPKRLFTEDPQEYLRLTLEKSMEMIDPRKHINQVMATCWRVGDECPSYRDARHIAEDVGDKMQDLGIELESTERLIANWVESK